MSDLYGNNAHARSSSLESEDMNSFLHNLFHNSFTPPASYSLPPIKEKHDQPFSSQPPTAADSSAIGTVDSSVGFNFADPGRGFMADARDRPRYTFSKVCSDGITSTLTGKFPAEYDIDDFESDGKEAGASDTPSDPTPRRSAKRTRAAEVHNLSEKRRRSRINEKMKALQKLIPNSNKTDKASMLDEAIEYLKQLQLQVQMLSMRNGMSLYPFCSLGSIHATQLPQPEIAAEEHELLTTSAGDSFARNKEISVQGAFEALNQCPPSNQPNLLSPETDITDSKTPFGLEASARHHLGLLNHLTSPKDICQVSQLQLDMSCSGKNSSSGVSS